MCTLFLLCRALPIWCCISTEGQGAQNAVNKKNERGALAVVVIGPEPALTERLLCARHALGRSISVSKPREQTLYLLPFYQRVSRLLN